MYNVIILKVKCPHCGQSFMDDKHLIDDHPSTKLALLFGKKKGNIWFSSVYGSFHYDSETPLTEDEIGEFYCPHCEEHLTSEETCSICHSHMVDMKLEIGGKFGFCSRFGCKKRNVAFDDLTAALEHFNEIINQKAPDNFIIEEPPKRPITKEEELAELARMVQNGTYMHIFCPYCRKNLNSNKKLILNISRKDGKCEQVQLYPYWHVLTKKSTIRIPDPETVTDMQCPRCSHTLKLIDELCPKSSNELYLLHVGTFTKLINYYLCIKKDCHWHPLTEDDIQNIVLRSTQEW